MLVLVSAAARAQAQPRTPWKPEPVDEALSEELTRSMSGLREEGYPLPYYIGLNAANAESEERRCILGREHSYALQKERLLTADVRVGGYELDNHPLAPSSAQVAQELPSDGDVFSIRHEIWQELDERYKNAAADFLRKQALRVRRGKTEYDTDDMTREPASSGDFLPDSDKTRAARAAAESERLAKLCRDLSGVFRQNPSLLGSDVTADSDVAVRRFLDSAGSRVRYEERLVRFRISAVGIASDGLKVSSARSFTAPSLEDMPDASELSRAARDVSADVDALRQAPSTSPFSAPALVDPSVGAAILQAFATRLSGEQQRNPEGAQTFRDKLGKPVLPKFLSLVDDPTLEKFGDRRLAGHYAVDDQGVPAQRVVLVDRGILRAYLLSRYPVIGFSRSNGHGRASPGRLPMGRPGNLFLESSKAYPQKALIEMLRRECLRRGKPYGLWIMKSRLWRQQDTTDRQQAFRLMPSLVYLVDAKTGEKTLVRDLDMVGTPLNLLAKILAVGDDPRAVNDVIDDASGPLPASAVSPTLLLREAELQRGENKPERPPILPAPRP